jgi:hypothetical protein
MSLLAGSHRGPQGEVLADVSQSIVLQNYLAKDEARKEVVHKHTHCDLHASRVLQICHVADVKSCAHLCVHVAGAE